MPAFSPGGASCHRLQPGVRWLYGLPDGSGRGGGGMGGDWKFCPPPGMPFGCAFARVGPNWLVVLAMGYLRIGAYVPRNADRPCGSKRGSSHWMSSGLYP